MEVSVFSIDFNSTFKQLFINQIAYTIRIYYQKCIMCSEVNLLIDAHLPSHMRPASEPKATKRLPTCDRTRQDRVWQQCNFSCSTEGSTRREKGYGESGSSRGAIRRDLGAGSRQVYAARRTNGSTTIRKANEEVSWINSDLVARSLACISETLRKEVSEAARCA